MNDSLLKTKQVFDKLNHDDNKIFENFVNAFEDNISLFNDMQSKSQILYYHHDLENRSSFMLDDEFLKDYIKYEHDNVDITKEIILKDIKNISDHILHLYLSKVESNEEFKKFFIFLYYLDKENFVDLMTLIIMAYLDFLNVDYSRISKESDSFLNETLIGVKTNPIIQKEIKIIKECLNLMTRLK